VVFDETFFPFTKKVISDYDQYTTLYNQWADVVNLLDSTNTTSVDNPSTNHTTEFQLPPSVAIDHTHTSQYEGVPHIPASPQQQSDSVTTEQQDALSQIAKS